MAADIRIGVLVPAGNTIHEREFDALRPAGVAFRFAGFAYPPADAADFCVDLAARMAEPVAALREWGARLLLVGCTAASMRCADPASEARLAQLAGVPVVTAASAVRDACAALGLKRLVVATPYGAASNGIVTRYLRSIGIEVTVAAIRGLDLDRSPEVWKREVPALSPRAGLRPGPVDRRAQCRGALPALHRPRVDRGHRAVRVPHRQAGAEFRAGGLLGKPAPPRHRRSTQRRRQAGGRLARSALTATRAGRGCPAAGSHRPHRVRASRLRLLV